MAWSGSKPLDGKWYRIRDDEPGHRQMLEARQQWAIEKGSDESSTQTFNHYVAIDGQWFVKRDVAYRQLFAEAPQTVEAAQGFERAAASDALDRLFDALKPVQEWVVYLEERLNDCELAIQYQLGDIAEHQSVLRGDSTRVGAEATDRQGRARGAIERCVNELQSLQAEHAALVDRLEREEGRRWIGMRCCAEIAGLSRETLLARFLDGAA